MNTFKNDKIMTENKFEINRR